MLYPHKNLLLIPIIRFWIPLKFSEVLSKFYVLKSTENIRYNYKRYNYRIYNNKIYNNKKYNYKTFDYKTYNCKICKLQKIKITVDNITKSIKKNTSSLFIRTFHLDFFFGLFELLATALGPEIDLFQGSVRLRKLHLGLPRGPSAAARSLNEQKK